MSGVSSIVVVGAGQAAASAVEALRSHDYTGRLTLVGDEPLPPYQRPPLSKKYLLGEVAVDNLLLLPESYYASNGVDLKLGRRATAIDAVDQTLQLEDGQLLPFDRLLLATGATPRKLPSNLAGEFEAIYTVRNVGDIDRIASRFTAPARVLVVGGGYIGLEVAAIARQQGLRTTVVESAARILQRVACQETSRYFAKLHRCHGVDLREGESLVSLSPRDDGSCLVRLSDETEFEVDFIMTGIGVDPATDLAENAGLDIENGIAVDRFCQTSNAKIFAAGDCASFPWRGRRIRLESVSNAIEQGRVAAANMLGKAAACDAIPWFWSDQYHVKLQIAGLNQGYDRTIAREGARAGASSVWYFRGSELLAVDAFNDAPAFMAARKFLAVGFSPNANAIGDPATKLKELLSDAARAE